jgi:hypothetical protein
MEPKGDKPRKIVVCHPDRYIDVQRAVTKLGYGDVLVQQNRHLPDVDKVYIMDGDTMRLIDGTACGQEQL